MFRVNETKPLRKKEFQKRDVVGPNRLGKILDMLKKENPHHAAPDDYVINVRGRRKRSQQPLFEKV